VGILLAAFLSCLVASGFARSVALSRGLGRFVPVSEELPGWPSKIDPLRIVPIAAGLSAHRSLVGITVDSLTQNGTVRPSSTQVVRYVFQDAPPIASGRECPRQVIKLAASGLIATQDVAHAACPEGGLRVLPRPACSTSELLQRYRALGGPAQGELKLEYFSASSGPAWRLGPVTGGRRWVIAGDCSRLLSDAEAAPAK